MLVQGVMDAVLQCADGSLWLIDYKTDSVKGEELKARAEHYRPQLMAYSEALSRILKKPVKECILFFLSSGEEYKL